METTEKSHCYPSFYSNLSKPLDKLDVKPEPDIIDTETVITKTEPNEIDIVECDVIHTIKPVIKLNTPSLKIELDTKKNCIISDGRVSKEMTDKTKMSRTNRKLSKISPKNKRITHVCEICDAKFDRFRILEVHMSNEHGSGKTYNKCQKCKLNFKQLSCLRYHINRAHIGSRASKLAYCLHCYKIFNATEQLHAHIKRMHFTITPGIIYYKQCYATFQSKNKFKRHIQLKHSTNDEHSHRRVKCKVCHRNFNHQYYFKEHYEEVHLNGSSVRKYPCQECTCSFRHPTSLYRHVQHKHNKIQCNISPSSIKSLQTLREHKSYNQKINFKCDYCNLCFTLKDNLIDHIILTHNSPLLPCTGCKAKFTCTDALKVHLVTSHPHKQSEYSCDICDKIFKSYTSFSYHNIHRHKAETICPVCGIKFAMRKSLVRHSKVHSRTNFSRILQMFICDLCKIAYTSKYALRRHIQSHLLELEFECRVCSQLFKTKVNLNMHVRLRHKPPRARQRDSFVRSESPQLKSNSNQRSTDLVRHIKCFKCEETFNQGRLFRKHMTDDHKVIIIFR